MHASRYYLSENWLYWAEGQCLNVCKIFQISCQQNDLAHCLTRRTTTFDNSQVDHDVEAYVYNDTFIPAVNMKSFRRFLKERFDGSETLQTFQNP